MSDITSVIISVSSVIGAIAVIGGVIFSIYRWYLKQNKQDEEIKKIKDENALVCYALIACLDGLKQLGANHSVTEAKEKLEKHLNLNAHL